MTSDKLRAAFLSFFEEKGHDLIPSSSLIPKGDPTMLLTTAGMVQIKPYFLGEAVPPNPRLTSCQKCFRTTDIEEVGDPIHLTFFEMLGNFSVGDYFKQEAINWGWEFVTQRLGLSPQRLWVTIFLDDDESFRIWREIGIPEERILRFGEQDNFWGPAGDSGPCGPCSEIHYDAGEEFGCGKASCGPNCDCGRFSEIWNLVFTQYNQDKEGNRTPLPKPNIDTGMGLERTVAAIQGKASVYETDLFVPMLECLSEISGKKYGSDSDTDNCMRIIAEHSRGIAFLISDGVIPSKGKRGYVLRRLLRRAQYFGETLAHDKPFITEVAKEVIANMGHVYPELITNRKHILDVIESEAENFRRTLPVGRGILQHTLIKMREELGNNFPKFEKDFREALVKQRIDGSNSLSSGVRDAIIDFKRSSAWWRHTLIVGGRDAIKETLQPIEDDLNALEQAISDYEWTEPDAFTNLKHHLEDVFQHIKTNVESVATGLSGYEAFILHDTYGFPIELTKEIAAERGFSVDLDGFEKEMEKQRERARASHRFKLPTLRLQAILAEEVKKMQESMQVALQPALPTLRLQAILAEEVKKMQESMQVALQPALPTLKAMTEVYRQLGIETTPFVGYQSLKHKSAIISLLVDGKSVEKVEDGKEASLILGTTPFYGEMGGQVGDTGKIVSSSGKFSVTNTVRMPPDIIVHQGKVVEGYLLAVDAVVAEVDKERRLDIARNHTATHLLQSALRQVLGEHVQQRGSLVAPGRLRFDFTHLTAMTAEEIREVEHIVNEKIRQNPKVYDEELPYKKAIEEGAIALFDEKYGDKVRVLKIGEPIISAELCGGTHVGSTGEIGFFHIISEGSIGAGLRRIEAVTGREAEAFINQHFSDLEKIAQSLGASPEDVQGKVSGLITELDEERKQRRNLESKLSEKIAGALLEQTEVVNGITVLAAEVPSSRPQVLREMSDLLRERLKSAVVVLGTIYDDKPMFLAAVTPDLVAKGYNAGEIVNQVAKATGGGGGGKAQFAQAGGKNKDRLDEALRLVKSLIQDGGR